MLRSLARPLSRRWLSAQQSSAYHKNVVDHYEQPRNVGSFDKSDPNVGTGLVGAPACGDVMKLQIKVRAPALPHRSFCARALAHRAGRGCAAASSGEWRDATRSHRVVFVLTPPPQTDDAGNIIDACFKTFGCGSAIASSSVATEWVKGQTLESATSITNSDIAKHLSLPPVKLHCSMLAEDAIKAAVKDLQGKKEKAAAAACCKASA